MNPKLARALRVCVSASLIVYLLTLIDLGGVAAILADLDPRWLALAFLLLLTQTALSSLKWKLILAADDVYARFPYLFRIYLIGNFISLFLPTSFGGDVYRVYSVGKGHGSMGKSASSVILDRLTGLFALVSIALFAYVALPESPYASWLVAGYLAGIVAFFLITSAPAVRVVDALPFARLRKLVAALARSFSTYRRRPGMLVAALCISLVFQFSIVLINKIYCTALGIQIPIELLLVVIPLVYLTEVLPISINGIGVRDSAFVYFFVLLDYTKEEGLALALVVLAMRYVFGLVGGGLFLIDSARRQPAG